MIIQEQSAKQVVAFRSRFWLRCLLGLATLVLVVGGAAPYLNADAFRGGIQDALEETLGRKVEIQKVRFSLFTGPGFTLERVTIQEDPRYGLEPFAYVPTLQVRVRLDKLLVGQIRPLGLRMEDASVNLVKSNDGTWNAVDLVERLGAPRRTPLNFFPAVEIANGRVDFKLGVRKTTFYLTETDISVYPESSGKIYFKFEGSPARTDRAGNGFGHLAGTANWYLQPAVASGNQLEADVTLQPSNLSELATLFQGQDVGVHGNVSAHVLISGPFSNLRAAGDMRLDDVHRWDLLPSPGDSWRVRFKALVDLRAHQLDLTTLPLSATENPLTLHLRAEEFMTKPSWSVLATMQKAPLASLLPLGRRMGMALPVGLQMDGALNGVIGFSNATGVQGGVVITNAVATIPNVPPLRSAAANITISGNKIHIDPAILQSDTGGTLRAGGDFDLGTQDLTTDISVDEFSIAAFKQTTNAWFGSPKALAILQDGSLTGRFRVSSPTENLKQNPVLRPAWSGQAQVTDATLNFPGGATPVKQFQGKANFDDSSLDMPRMSGVVGNMPFTGSYRYAVSAKHQERVRLQFSDADLGELETAFSPTLSDNGLLSRLTFKRRSIAPWLASRNMDGDLSIDQCSVAGTAIGSLRTHFLWQGPAVQLSDLSVGLPAGKIRGSGNVELLARVPHYHFSFAASELPWNAGLIALDGTLDTTGMGAAALQHIQSRGEFTGDGVVFAGADPLSHISGEFTFAFSDLTPVLKLSEIEAHQSDGNWLGEGASTSDGKLHLELTNGERKIHLVSGLMATRSIP